MIPLFFGAAAKWLLVGGAVVAGGALLGSSDKPAEDNINKSDRKISASEVPKDILEKAAKDKRKFKRKTR